MMIAVAAVMYATPYAMAVAKARKDNSLADAAPAASLFDPSLALDDMVDQVSFVPSTAFGVRVDRFRARRPSRNADEDLGVSKFGCSHLARLQMID